MAARYDKEFEALKWRAIECFKYKAYEEGEAAASAAEGLYDGDPALNFYHSLLLFELSRRNEALERLRAVSRLSPRETIARASGQYLARRMRTSEGYRREDGWIAMLEVALESRLLPAYTSDRIAEGLSDNSDTGRRLIPRSIIQFWNTEQLPEEVRLLSAQVGRVNPDFSHKIFSELEARDVLNSLLGSEAVALFDSCPHIAAKADFFRVAYLYENGGVYIDADEVCTRPMSDTVLANDFDLVLSYTKAMTSCINNWFLAAAPKLSLLGRVLENLMGNLHMMAHHGVDANIWVTTGPGVWTFSVLDLALDPLAYASGSPFAKSCFIEENAYRKWFESPPMNYKATANGNWRLAQAHGNA